jgi:hypothetical protein
MRHVLAGRPLDRSALGRRRVVVLEPDHLGELGVGKVGVAAEGEGEHEARQLVQPLVARVAPAPLRRRRRRRREAERRCAGLKFVATDVDQVLEDGGVLLGDRVGEGLVLGDRRQPEPRDPHLRLARVLLHLGEVLAERPRLVVRGLRDAHDDLSAAGEERLALAVVLVLECLHLVRHLHPQRRVPLVQQLDGVDAPHDRRVLRLEKVGLVVVLVEIGRGAARWRAGCKRAHAVRRALPPRQCTHRRRERARGSQPECKHVSIASPADVVTGVTGSLNHSLKSDSN